MVFLTPRGRCLPSQAIALANKEVEKVIGSVACKEQSIDSPCCEDPSRTAKPLQDKDSINMMTTNTRFPTQLFHESLRMFNVVL